ncbi:MAG: HAMP domain-containing histidine kinase [Tissierella sp.]|nr:HAMP domain-containing histidine kinase [Tissierella sp.]
MDSLNKPLLYKIISLIAVLLLSILFSMTIYHYHENLLFDKLATVVGVITEDSKDLEILAMNQLKSDSSQYTAVGKDTLESYGYNDDKLIFLKDRKGVIYSSILFSLFLTSLYLIGMAIFNRNKRKNINTLKEYLENINKGEYVLNIDVDEDFAIVSDELYKTVVSLRELKEKADKDKSILKNNIADISHQLKTPITSINIMSQLMEDSNSKDENKEYIHRLNKQIERLEELTNSLLTISKLDADAIQFKEEIIDFIEIIELATEPILLLIEKKNIQLSIIGDNSSIQGDSHWLSEAFLNIIKNSVEHIDNNGKIDIIINSNPIFKEIIIEDNGIGFLKEDMPYIFNRFYKGKNANKDSIGIGLSMAKLIIEKHNGEIRVENRSHGGARFRIKFYP